MLIAGVVHDQGDRPWQACRDNLTEQQAHGFGIDVLRVGYAMHLVGNGIQGRQHIVTFATGGARDEQPDQTPQKTQKRPVDEMRGIDKQYRPPAFQGLVQPWLELGFQKLRLGLDIGFGRNGSYFAIP